MFTGSISTRRRPVGTKSLSHLHRDSDEVAWVLAGEITFKIGDDITVGGPGTCAFFPRNVRHAWKNTGSETGRVLFLYAPAAAGGYVEELCAGPLDEPRGPVKLRPIDRAGVGPRVEPGVQVRRPLYVPSPRAS